MRAVCALIAVSAVLSPLHAQRADAALAFGVTDTSNTFVIFDTATPGMVGVIGPITGLLPGEQILALDFRPLTGRLYGVSSTHLYVIDPFTATASLVSPTPFTILNGAVAMDFDPVTDTIRVIDSTSQNVRIDPQTGAGTVATPFTPTSSRVGLAATNNFAGASSSMMFAIDAVTDTLLRVGPDLDAGTVSPVGALGFDIDVAAGFDITANDNIGWAAVAAAADTSSTLVRVNLGDGAVTPVGSILVLAEKLRAFAVQSRAVTLYGLTSTNALVTFQSAVPGTLLPAGSTEPVAITGLNPGETIVAIDVRPATGALYGISNTNRLFTIDPRSGVASSAGALPPMTVTGAVVGFDFDPVADRVRVSTDSGQNLVVNPGTGAVTPDTAWSAGGIVGLAYLNPVADATTTSLYAIDEDGDQLMTIATPANGVATPVGPLGVDVGPLTGFESVPADNGLFAAITAPGGTATTLYSVAQDGAATPIGVIGGGATIRGLAAAAVGLVRFSSLTYSVLENAGSALVSVERINGSDGPITVRLEAQTTPSADASDFVPATFTVEFAPGETSKTVSIGILDDAIDEVTPQTIDLVLSQPRLGAALGDPAAATLTIIDNDPSAGGTAPTVAITAPTSGTTYTGSSLFLTLAGTAADTDGTIASILVTTDKGYSATASSGTAAASVDWFASDVRVEPGVTMITVTATDNVGNQSTDTLVVTLNELSYYLAEGATGGFFDLDLLLANPNPTPVTATVTYLKNLGSGTIVQHYTLGATSRQTVNVEAVPGLEGTEVSTIVTVPATHPIIVERTMRWNDTGYGAHTDKASPNTSTKWYFAEGSQGFFYTYLLLANPHDAANEVTVTYFREGTTAVTRTYELDPLQRFTVDIGADAELVNNSFGMEVTFALPGIAERAMYFGRDPLWLGGHESVGVTLPSREWFLAEGATGPFFETFVLVVNPSSAAAAELNVRYLPLTGVPVEREYTLPPQGRLTINVELEDASLINTAIATQVTSNIPVLVERAQYWPDPFFDWYEAHNSFGVTDLGTKWGLAEGRVGGPSAYQTYILLANPGTTAADVTIQFLKEDGTTVTKVFQVEANTRFNVAVGTEAVPEITEGSFGAVISSTQPIAVERAMYSDAGGRVWNAGTNATATRLP